MIGRVLLISCLLAPPIGAAEIDLFVTDYNDDPARDQRPMAERPVTYANPQSITIRPAGGEAVTYKRPVRVTVRRSAANFIPVFSHRPQAVIRILLLLSKGTHSPSSRGVIVKATKPGEVMRALPCVAASNLSAWPVYTCACGLVA